MWYYKAKDRVIMKVRGVSRSGRKVHGGVGMGDAALLSENRVRRGGKRFGFQPHDVGLAQFVALPAFLGGGRSGRKVHGGNRNRMHGFEFVRAGGGRSRKVHGGRQKYISIWGGS